MLPLHLLRRRAAARQVFEARPPDPCVTVCECDHVLEGPSATWSHVIKLPYIQPIYPHQPSVYASSHGEALVAHAEVTEFMRA